MTDKELLEKAAKAAGFERTHERGGCFCYTTRGGGSVKWNPLEDDGDALRLAVLLDMSVEVNRVDEVVMVVSGYHGQYRVKEPFGDDMYAAARRTIVLAAVELGDA